MRASHKSTKWNRARRIFRKALKKQVKRQDLVTLTEVAGRLWWRMPAMAATKTSELAILWRRTTMRSGGPRRVGNLSKKGLPTRGGQLVDYLMKPLIVRADKVRWAVCAVHVPSDAEDKDGFARTVNAQISKECFLTMSDLWNEWVDEFDEVVIRGDMNLNYRLEWVQDLVDDLFPGGHVTWDRGLPERGTHGDRLIDWSISTSPIHGARVLPQTGDTDHKEYEEVM